ncbi:UDP-N-acetylglucosamine 2-epimerase (non-hydrolyzing) [Tamlana sp. 2201CG12-4]|uniref:non-hydrolyzing UDP-N-acetylglucosamine 2-epimerase n=1 Tax=Tamlana sp. 2201CG12-4 TaxID=3112582 RepID=UPI002DC03E93|nr:UDP-N-acetylglucosamine 2-epimerase (non-hydrolyzing) [Tamlana sp. 2201CG12-4]MEC3907335.1 UDP-N-acetylglucosamine 2-epimerase (non-hydrolyzing) [Tamlana sp. 2201CG12-4]
MKILICFGTRPEAIKMAPICLALAKEKIAFKLCVTAQHREMLDQVLTFFGIIPDYDLDIMQPNQSLNKLSSKILLKMDGIFEKENFDMVLVHGDTTTSSLVALSAFHRKIKVSHVEAGLRTYNKLSPFPEELNRQITGRIADFHFAPTVKAKQNLLKEQVNETKIIVTGNTVIDALLIAKDKLDSGFNNVFIDDLKQKIDFKKKIVLITGHRRESFGEGFENLCDAVLEIAKRDDVEIVYPVHLNPNVKSVVNTRLFGVKNIHLLEPLNYPSFVWLMSKSNLIISDSGGIQEEAPTFKIPVIVTRDITERAEGIKEGCSFLVGTNTSSIINKADDLLNTSDPLKGVINPYGKGDASKLIVDFLQSVDV